MTRTNVLKDDPKDGIKTPKTAVGQEPENAGAAATVNQMAGDTGAKAIKGINVENEEEKKLRLFIERQLEVAIESRGGRGDGVHWIWQVLDKAKENGVNLELTDAQMTGIWRKYNVQIAYSTDFEYVKGYLDGAIRHGFDFGRASEVVRENFGIVFSTAMRKENNTQLNELKKPENLAWLKTVDKKLGLSERSKKFKEFLVSIGIED